MGSATVERRTDRRETGGINITTFADGYRPPDLLAPAMLELFRPASTRAAPDPPQRAGASRPPSVRALPFAFIQIVLTELGFRQA